MRPNCQIASSLDPHSRPVLTHQNARFFWRFSQQNRRFQIDLTQARNYALGGSIPRATRHDSLSLAPPHSGTHHSSTPHRITPHRITKRRCARFFCGICPRNEKVRIAYPCIAYRTTTHRKSNPLSNRAGVSILCRIAHEGNCWWMGMIAMSSLDSR